MVHDDGKDVILPVKRPEARGEPVNIRELVATANSYFPWDASGLV